MNRAIPLIFAFVFLAPLLVHAELEPVQGMDCGELKNRECSNLKPVYCENGVPVENCTKCGCEEGWNCNSFSQKCQETGEIEFEVVSENGTKESPMQKRAGGAIEFVIVNNKGKRLTAQNIFSVNASTKGRDLEVTEKQDGVFSVEIEPGFLEGDSAILLIQADVKTTKRISEEQAIEVFFENEEIKIEISFRKNSFFEGEKIDLVEIQAGYSDGEVPELSELEFVVESKGAHKCSGKEKNENGIVIDYPVRAGDFVQELDLTITGVDSFGNRVIKEAVVPLASGRNPLFALAIEPKAETFAFCNTSTFTAEVFSTEKSKLTGLTVKISSAELGVDESMQQETQFRFSRSIELPCEERNPAEFTLEILATAEINGETVSYAEKRKATLTEQLGIEFVSPEEGITNINGALLERIELKLNAGEDLTGPDKVNALLKVDNVERNLVLEKNTETGIHSATLTPGVAPGDHVFEISLKDGFSGNKAIHSTLNQSIEFELMVFAVLFPLFLIGFSLYRKKHKASENRTEKEQFEITKRKRMLKDLKFAYYKRRISEKEFKEASMKITQELSELFQKKKNPKKTQESKETREKSVIENRIEEIKKKREKGLPL